MLRLCCFIMLLCGSVALLEANNNDPKGYVVLNNNDTLCGKVLTVGSFLSNKTKVRLRTENGKQKFDMAEVQALRMRGYDYWRLRYWHINRWFTGYLKVISAGKISLLYHYCQTARLKYDLYILLEDGRLIPVNSFNFEAILLPWFQSSEAFRQNSQGETVKMPSYNRHFLREVEKLVRWYNGT